MTRWKKAGWAVLLAAVAMQFIPVRRTNPVPLAPFTSPPDVERILHTSCSDCHSSQTRWPWYSRVAPVSWLVAHDVKEGRRNFNLSDWGTYPPAKQARIMNSIADVVAEGEMPPLIYELGHREARLSPADAARLQAWAGVDGDKAPAHKEEAEDHD